MFRSVLIQLTAGIGGLWLADRFLENVTFTGSLQALALAGAVLAAANILLKPILNLITLPLRVLTLGLSGILVNMALVLGIDILFPELTISGILALFWTTLLVWGIGTVLSFAGKTKQ
ncbi:MAG: phage holin family protein [Candidatus Yanofskybacteria bacterium]|nr:phage holin family protein [Candidatus Yanofskybacteria bacterium]